MKITRERLKEIIEEEILREVVSERVKGAIQRAHESKGTQELDAIWEAHEENKFDPESEFYISKDDREAIKEAWNAIEAANNK